MSDLIKSREIKLVKISEIKLNPKNRNKHPKEQIERLKEIIEYNGFRRPVSISNRTGQLVCGEGRYLAAKAIGLKEIPAIFQDYDTPEQEFADSIADNAIDKWAELDHSGIITDAMEFDDFNFDMMGIEDFQLPTEIDQEKEAIEDDVPENVETRVKPGDLWQLGEHRLLCGDATNIQHVERLMGGEKADMVFTDPPYGISFDDKSNSEKQKRHTGKISEKFGVIKNDDVDIQEFVDAIFSFFMKCNRIFIWGILNGNGKVPKGSFIVWDKKLEQQRDVPYGDFDICWSKNVGWKMLRHVWGGFKNKEKGEVRFHPTQKPISLVQDFFERWGNIDDKVVDLFGGSGSTLIACEKTKRKCFMMEIDPYYCSVILERWEKYSGNIATLIQE